MSPRHVRALRGSAAAWMATIVAATAHTLAGGGAPSPVFVAVIGILVSPVAMVLVGRRLAVWRAALVVVGGQGLFHASFAMTAGADPNASHGHHAAHLSGPAIVALPDMPMLAAHAVAAVLTVAALYGGERMLRALAAGIRTLFTRAVAIAPRPASPRLVAAERALLHPGAAFVLAPLSRRGPPAFVAAAR
ncbi:hypothetical protein [Microbacterium timonense]|uniref:hypothetical protein n=1 Tax=Microbacterium timonense TaxID=2086576 RepID=UPI000D0E7011|nr:hypothetical protein [Microbacterium timonense]